MIAERRKKAESDREAQLLARRSRTKKSTASGSDKGKGVSSVTTNVIAECVTAQPVARETPIKGRISRSPASYDVEKLARRKPPSDIDEGVRDELGKLPKLPIPRECPSFGVLGTGPKYARHVVAPYISFAGDRAKLSSQSSSDIFDSMLESTTDVMAKLAFSAQVMDEKDVAVQRSAMESKNEVERLRTLVHSFDAERDSFNAEREQLVEAVVQQYTQGEKKGELRGWDEAVRAFLDLGHITQATVDGVKCPFTLPLDDCEYDDLMETEGACGAVGGEVTGEETA